MSTRDAAPQVLLVTGGSRGIGAAIVRKAVRAGAAVGFTFQQDQPAADSLCAELRGGQCRVHAVKGDIADPAFAARALNEIEQQLGPVTSLVNNAGIAGRYGAFADLPVDVLRRTLDVNVLGTMMFTQEAVKRWRAGGMPGRVVNVSSIASSLGSPHEFVHYAASKAAVEAFTVGLGKELAAENIRVNAVAPGIAWTDIHAATGAPDRPSKMVGRVPMQRIAEPAEIANAVLWLLSDEASYVTGTVLKVSGGL